MIGFLLRPTGRRLGFASAFVVIAIVLTACSSRQERPEGLDPSTIPQTIRADYAVFAQRCSKCHSLSRPLDSGIDSDDAWDMYVARMRRQPSSGISERDASQILRFLHYLSLEQRRLKANPAPTATSPAAKGAP